MAKGEGVAPKLSLLEISGVRRGKARMGDGVSSLGIMAELSMLTPMEVHRSDDDDSSLTPPGLGQVMQGIPP